MPQKPPSEEEKPPMATLEQQLEEVKLAATATPGATTTPGATAPKPFPQLLTLAI
jgi:hypothetical protein